MVRKTEKKTKKKPKHSLDTNRSNKRRNKGGSERSAATVRRLKMYNTKPKHNCKGKSLKYALQSKELPNTRIQPDRGWFENSRVVNQNQLEQLREELQQKMANNCNVILNKKELPLSLLNGGGQKH